MAQKETRNDETAKQASVGVASGQNGARAGLRGPALLVVCVVVALVVGALLGYFVLAKTSSATFSGQTTVAQGDLDKAVASYTYEGTTETISVRDAIESQASLDSVKTDDDTYTLPSADTALTVARNKILAKVAEKQGITVSDDELSSYAEQMTGSSDFSSIASNYGLTEAQAKQIIRESAAMNKLKDQVVSTDAGTAPTAPTTPADESSDEANSTYGAYIVELLGDEWDSANNTWARTDGPYYEALSSEVFSADSATYAQAEKAYYVAYSQYSASSSTVSSEWTNYVNGVLSTATIQIFTLGA